MKTNKHLTLTFINKKETVRGGDIANQFDYSPGTARSYLSHIARQGLIERGGAGYSITSKGRDRLEYFDISGCGNFDCPLCQKKKAGHITCPECGHQVPAKKARIKAARDYILWQWDAGVYCPKCEKLILSENKALLIGIEKEG